jgi:ribosomal protein S18 acetylase RimI-like enzyme
MNIRPIENRDLPELFELRAKTRENPYSREALREIGITEETTAALLLTTHRGWLCECEGVKAGFAIGDGGTGEITVVAVLPEFEGRRIGTLLLSQVENWLGSKGWKQLWLWTSSDTKKRAFAFYLKRGWVLSEIDGHVAYLRKVLNPSKSNPLSHD